MSTPIESPPGGWGYAKENPMTAPDSPTPEVRDEWVEKAAQALHETTAHPTAWVDLPDWMLNEARFKARAALAAVVPLVQQQTLRDAADAAEIGDGLPEVAAMLRDRADALGGDDRCHCGEPVAHGYDGNPDHHRGMCTLCDSVRCDAYPGACER